MGIRIEIRIIKHFQLQHAIRNRCAEDGDEDTDRDNKAIPASAAYYELVR